MKRDKERFLKALDLMYKGTYVRLNQDGKDIWKNREWALIDNIGVMGTVTLTTKSHSTMIDVSFRHIAGLEEATQ